MKESGVEKEFEPTVSGLCDMVNAKNLVVDLLATRVSTLEQSTSESSSQLSHDPRNQS